MTPDRAQNDAASAEALSQDEALAHYREAARLYKAGRNAEAIAILERLDLQFPGQRGIGEALARCRQAMGGEAAEALEAPEGADEADDEAGADPSAAEAEDGHWLVPSAPNALVFAESLFPEPRRSRWFDAALALLATASLAALAAVGYETFRRPPAAVDAPPLAAMPTATDGLGPIVAAEPNGAEPEFADADGRRGITRWRCELGPFAEFMPKALAEFPVLVVAILPDGADAGARLLEAPWLEYAEASGRIVVALPESSAQGAMIAELTAAYDDAVGLADQRILLYAEGAGAGAARRFILELPERVMAAVLAEPDFAGAAVDWVDPNAAYAGALAITVVGEAGGRAEAWAEGLRAAAEQAGLPGRARHIAAADADPITYLEP